MDDIFIRVTDKGERQMLRLSRANSHGLVAGATGTGKTVTLQTIAGAPGTAIGGAAFGRFARGLLGGLLR